MAVAAQYDAPAYVRRARGVEAAYEDLLARGRRQRRDWLMGVRLHLGSLRAGMGGWSARRPFLGDENQIRVRGRLPAEAGDPDVPMTGRADPRGGRGARAGLGASAGRFNRRWLAYVEGLD